VRRLSGIPSEKRASWLSLVAVSIALGLLAVAVIPGFIRPHPAIVAEPVPPGEPASPSTPAKDGAMRASQSAPAASTVTAFAPSGSFDCMISANETIEIGSSIVGTLETIAVERSDYVEKGQVLATLESRVEESAVRLAAARAERSVEMDSTRVNLVLGKKRRDRAINLHKANSLSLDLREEVETEARLAELSVEEAEENHRLAILQLEQAQAALERRTIRSPVAGFVTERLMAQGEVVDDETILTIAQIDPLRVDVILPTHLFGTIAPGDEMEILPEPPLDRPQIAKVSVADRVLDGASGTFGVRLLLPNSDYALPSGLRCSARLLQDAHDQDDLGS